MNQYEIVNILVDIKDTQLSLLASDCLKQQYPKQFKEAMKIMKRIVKHQKNTIKPELEKHL